MLYRSAKENGSFRPLIRIWLCCAKGLCTLLRSDQAYLGLRRILTIRKRPLRSFKGSIAAAQANPSAAGNNTGNQEQLNERPKAVNVPDV
jgi:hypothetical protein